MVLATMFIKADNIRYAKKDNYLLQDFFKLILVSPNQWTNANSTF